MSRETMSSRLAGPWRAPKSLVLAAGAIVLLLNITGCYLFQRGANDKLAWSESALDSAQIRKRAEEADELYRSPRTPERVEKSFRLALDSISASNDHQGLLQAARAASWLAENVPEKRRKEEFARQGIAAAREAVALLPDRVESHYYLALNLGQLSDVLQSPRFVKEMAASAEAASGKDEKFDRAGPHRFLGLLNLEGEKHRLITGYGDLDVALKHLSRAVELFPEDGENHLAYARALADDEDYTAARRELAAVLASKPSPDLDAEHDGWLRQARELEEKLKGK
jgi:tetratricopeptide repeat protein